MDLAHIATEVVEAGGVKTYQMSTIRDAAGAGRLGVHVRAKISGILKGEGIAHWPADLPDSQHAHIRLYKMGSNAGNLIEAVLNVDPSKDATITELVSENGYQSMVEQIREIVS